MRKFSTQIPSVLQTENQILRFCQMNKMSFMSGSGTFQSVMIPLGHEGVINYSYTLSGKIGMEKESFQMDT